MIVLSGCELAFYIQNYRNYRHNYEFSAFSLALKKLSRWKLQVSKAVVQRLLDFLAAGHIVIGLKTEAGDEAYLPAVDTNILTIAYVLNALERCGQNNLPYFKPEQALANIIISSDKWLESSDQNRLLKDI